MIGRTWLAQITVLLLAPLASAKAEPLSYYRTLTLGQLMWNMEAAAEPIGVNAGDLGPAPQVGGMCRSFGDVLIDFPSAAIDQCITPTAEALLKTCNVPLQGEAGPATVSGTADCMTSLVSTLNPTDAVDRVTGALPAVLTCMSKSLVQASRLSGPEKTAAMGVIDGVSATYDEYTKLAELAANLATGGVGTIPDFLAVDASGNDGDSSSTSVADWLIEADKIAQDPVGYARAQSVAKVETGLTSMIAGAIMEPTQTLEDLANWWDPDRPLGNTDTLLRQCAMTDAQLVWATRRAQLETAVAEARINMEHYRNLTYCQLTEGARDFNAMPDDEKRWLLEGVDQFGRFSGGQSTTTNYTDWQGYRDDYAAAVAAYDDFREREAEFQQAYELRRAELAPFLEEADRLRALARANVRQCVAGVVPTQRLGLFEDPVRELEAQVLDLKARMLGFGCSIPMANSFIAGIQHEIENPYLKWSEFIARARSALSTGAACRPGAADALVAELQEVAAASFGSLPSMQQCLDSEAERQTVAAVFGLAAALEGLDSRIAEAAQATADCEPEPAQTAIASARDLLAGVSCASQSGIGSRQHILDALEQRLAQPNCGSAETDGTLQAIYRVSGSGFIPHWAGGSYFTEGHQDVLVTVEEPSNAAFRQVLQDAYDYYWIDPCEADIPAWPGLGKTPVIWMSGPQVEYVFGPAPDLSDEDLDDDWIVDQEGDYPSLFELKGAACR